MKNYYNNITQYTATDYSTWDGLFENQERRANKFGWLSRLLYGVTKNPEAVDLVCSALDLPYDQGQFDSYLSFETLEHISEPELFFSEASRVLHAGGKLIISVPFLYREHSDGTGQDYYRPTASCLKLLCEKNNLKVIRIFTYSYFGTTLAILINQYIISKILEVRIITKIILFPLSPIIFIITNCVGWLIDSLYHDERFASRLHLIAEKV